MTDTITTPLAELLLRRKELNALYAVRLDAKKNNLTKDVIQRQKINDEIDQVTGRISRIDKDKLEAENNYYAHQRRLADSVIQQANWTTEVTIPSHTMSESKDDAKSGDISVKLAELLIRRKELDTQDIEFNIHFTPAEDLFQMISERLPIADGTGKLVEKVERKSPCELKPFQQADTLQADLYKIDACIQKTNWDTLVDVPKTVFDNFVV